MQSEPKYRRAIDAWTDSAGVAEGHVLRPVNCGRYDLRKLIAKRRDIFAAYLQMKLERREEAYPEGVSLPLLDLKPPPQPHRQQDRRAWTV